jgi:A/G-specific adenine glycosylase
MPTVTKTFPSEAYWKKLRVHLAGWYVDSARDLPWRHTSDPYAITVSEMMLQQTQVATVIPYYTRWIKQFPTWLSLARAKEPEVIKAWEGLGYYRRARNLQAIAKIVAMTGDTMLKSEEGLLKLPGIGPYTAAAIGSIAFGLPLAVLDGNVMRVLTRLLALSDDIALPQARVKLQEIATAFLDVKDPSTHNQAVMELGATVCLPHNPMCLICPLQQGCVGKDHAEDFPVKTRIATEKRAETVAIIRHGNRFYCEQVPEGKPWHGLWRFPDFDKTKMRGGRILETIKYGITKYVVTMDAVEAKWKGHAPVSMSVRYLTPEEMKEYAFAAPHRKLAKLLVQSSPSANSG